MQSARLSDERERMTSAADRQPLPRVNTNAKLRADALHVGDCLKGLANKLDMRAAGFVSRGTMHRRLSNRRGRTPLSTPINVTSPTDTLDRRHRAVYYGGGTGTGNLFRVHETGLGHDFASDAVLVLMLNPDPSGGQLRNPARDGALASSVP
jgi:hypothetical protein